MSRIVEVQGPYARVNATDLVPGDLLINVGTVTYSEEWLNCQVVATKTDMFSEPLKMKYNKFRTVLILNKA